MRGLGIVLAMGIVAVGCGGHVLMSGSVVKTEGANDARVCLLGGRVHVGSIVRVIHHTCERDEAKPSVVHCSRQVAGTARVVAIVDEHYLIVHSGPDVTIHEGDTVEPVGR